MNKNQTLQLISDLSVQENKKPIIIEFSGTPNSGKTSLIDSIYTIFRRYKIKSKIICENAKYCKITTKRTPQFNYWTALETIQKILSSIDQGFKIIICDRGVFDALVWMKFYLDDKQISLSDYNTITKFYLLNEWRQYVQYVISMTCDTETSIRRDIDYNEFGVYGTIVNPEVIPQINSAINETIKMYSKKFNNIVQYDTTNNIEEVKKNIMNQLFSYLLFYMQ